MRVLLDTNVVCDWLLGREPWKAEAQAIAGWTTSGKLTCLVSATTVVNLFYVARKLVGREAAQSLVAQCLRSLEVWPTDHSSLLAALAMPGKDFEDNVQIAVAIAAAADGIITRDPTGFRHSTVPVYLPFDFIAQLHP